MLYVCVAQADPTSTNSECTMPTPLCSQGYGTHRGGDGGWRGGTDPNIWPRFIQEKSSSVKNPAGSINLARNLRRGTEIVPGTMSVR